MQFDTLGERPLMGVQPLELRQQRRVNVEDLALPARHEPGRQAAQEARKAYEADCMGTQLGVDGLLEGLAILAEIAMIHDFRRDAGGLGSREPGCVGHIRDDEDDPGRVVGCPCGFEEGRHVAAAPGNEDGGRFAIGPIRRHNASRPR
jgi:hypothetical protein